MSSFFPNAPPSQAIRYAISNRRAFADLDHRRYLRRLFAVSSHAVQLREKDLDQEALARLLEVAAEEARRRGRVLLVNSPGHLQLPAGAGVHLTSGQTARRWEKGGRPAIVGKSVHSLEAALEAEAEGVDYLLLSPIFAPLSKSASGPLLGLEGLRRTAGRVKIPVLALGGAGPWKEKEILQAGGAGFAGITWAHREMLD